MLNMNIFTRVAQDIEAFVREQHHRRRRRQGQYKFRSSSKLKVKSKSKSKDDGSRFRSIEGLTISWPQYQHQSVCLSGSDGRGGRIGMAPQQQRQRQQTQQKPLPNVPRFSSGIEAEDRAGAEVPFLNEPVTHKHGQESNQYSDDEYVDSSDNDDDDDDDDVLSDYSSSSTDSWDRDSSSSFPLEHSVSIAVSDGFGVDYDNDNGSDIERQHEIQAKAGSMYITGTSTKSTSQVSLTSFESQVRCRPSTPGVVLWEYDIDEPHISPNKHGEIDRSIAQAFADIDMDEHNNDDSDDDLCMTVPFILSSSPSLPVPSAFSTSLMVTTLQSQGGDYTEDRDGDDDCDSCSNSDDDEDDPELLELLLALRESNFLASLGGTMSRKEWATWFALLSARKLAASVAEIPGGDGDAKVVSIERSCERGILKTAGIVSGHADDVSSQWEREGQMQVSKKVGWGSTTIFEFEVEDDDPPERKTGLRTCGMSVKTETGVGDLIEFD